MTTIKTLRGIVNQRLTTAVEEIFELLESTISKYEEEIVRQRKLLDHTAEPETRRGDVPQLLEIKEEFPSEQQEWSSSLDQEHPYPPHIKQEEEEPWSSRDGEPLQRLKETDIIKLSFTAAPVKREVDEGKAQSSHLDESQTGENQESEAPASSAAQQMNPDASDAATERIIDDWKETQNLQTHSSRVKHSEVYVIIEKSNCSRDKMTHSCSVCRKNFSQKGSLQRHIKIHTGEKPFSCSVCGKKFGRKQHLQEHMVTHTGERPFTCSICRQRFRLKGGWRKHMRRHAEEEEASNTHNETAPQHRVERISNHL